MYFPEQLPSGLQQLTVMEGEEAPIRWSYKVKPVQERKRQLSANADCLITLPGGVGTLDELFEAIAGERAHIISARIASCKLPRHVHSASCKGRPQHPPNLLNQHKRLL